MCCTGAVIKLEEAEANVRAWNCNFMGDKMNGPPTPSQRLHASTCFVEQSGFSMPADALGGRVGEFSCGLTSYCMPELLSTEPAILCMNCKQEQNGVTLLRGFACELATKQCVCGQRNMPATQCATSEDCGLADSMCNVQASFYSSSYSTQLCADSTGRSYCLKTSMHDGTGTCTSYVNDAANLVPACFQESLQVSKWQYDEQLCLGYGPDLGSVQGGVLMSDTFMFQCSEITSMGQNYKLACVRVLLDGTVQNSVLSYLTFNIRNTKSFGRRRLLDSDPDGNFGHPDSMLAAFVHQSAERIPRIVGACREVLHTCMQADKKHTDCTYCARVWWFANFTLSMSHRDHEIVVQQFDVRDTDLVDARSMLLKLSHAAVLIPHMLKHTPHGLTVLLRDWLQDDWAYQFIVQSARAPVRVLDDIVHALMQGAKKQTPRHANPPTRRLLQVNTEGSSLVLPAANALKNSLSSTRDAAVAQLHDTKYFFDVSSFGAIFDDATEQNRNLEKELTNVRLKTFSDAFDSSDDTGCMLSFGTVQNDIIMNFARVLAKDGWTVKPVCTRKQMLQFARTVPSCPILTAPFTRLYNNTMILAKYYAYMAQSGCLTNMSISCLPQAVFTETGILNALPRLSQDAKFTNQTLQNITQEKDILSLYILRFFYFTTDFITFDRTAMMSGVMAFVSTDALYDEAVQATMVRNNEYSIGRLMKDYFSCSLRQTISCEKKNLSLLPVFGALFIVISVVHMVLPVPSVISFFLWTIGLTWGVVYMSYNFSPLCAPRIPTCLGGGLYELSEQLLPLKIEIPTTLYHADKCNNDLTLKPEFASIIPNFACGKTCLDAPYKMNDIITVLIAIETWIRYDRALLAQHLLEQLDFVLPRYTNHNYMAIIDTYAADMRRNADGYVLGFVVCIFFNFYKLIAFFIVMTIFLPFCFNLVFSLLTFIGILILKYSFFAYGVDIYSSIH